MKHTALTSLALPVVLGLAIIAAGCKGEEKAKPAPPPAPPPRPVERPQAVAPEPPPPPPKKVRTGAKVVKSVTTAQGKLNVVRYGAKGTTPEYAVMLGDRTLIDPEERPIEVATSTPKGKANLVLLRFPRKDKECPARFRVADVTRGKDPRVSSEFGNCSAKPKVTSASGGWKLAFPKSGKNKAQTWTYAKGDLREAGQKGATGAGGYTGPI